MALEKDIVEAHKEQFDGKTILGDAFKQIISKNHEEAVGAAVKLYHKEYATRKEIKRLKEELVKAEQSLEKTTDKIKKVESGDLSALFEASKEADK